MSAPRGQPPGLLSGLAGHTFSMLLDIVIALILVVVAAALGIIVHPLLWFIVIVAVLWLFTRRGRWAGRY